MSIVVKPEIHEICRKSLGIATAVAVYVLLMLSMVSYSYMAPTFPGNLSNSTFARSHEYHVYYTWYILHFVLCYEYTCETLPLSARSCCIHTLVYYSTNHRCQGPFIPNYRCMHLPYSLYTHDISINYEFTKKRTY